MDWSEKKSGKVDVVEKWRVSLFLIRSVVPFHFLNKWEGERERVWKFLFLGRREIFFFFEENIFFFKHENILFCTCKNKKLKLKLMKIKQKFKYRNKLNLPLIWIHFFYSNSYFFFLKFLNLINLLIIPCKFLYFVHSFSRHK